METIHRAGPAPVKATNSLTVTWGLVVLPLSIYAGTDAGSTVKRNEFTVDGHPLGRQAYDKTTGATYTGDVVKKAAVAKDLYVDLTDEEIELVTGGVEKDRCDVETFVPLDTIGREYVVTDLKQIRPQKDVPGAGKSFRLLCDTMRELNVAALVKVTLRSNARYAVITPDGDLLMLAYADQVRPPRDMPEADISDNERSLARTLITDVTGISTPVLVNETGEKLTAYVASKAAGAAPVEAALVVPQAAPTDSLEAMLAAAVAAAKGTKADDAEAPAEKPKAKPRKKAAA